MKSRNVLIGVAAALVGLVAVTAIGIFVAGGDDGRRAGALSSRTYVAATWILHMENGSGYAPMGYLKDVKGCFAKNQVAEGPTSTDPSAKSVSGIAYEPCVIRFRGGMDQRFYNWLGDVFAGPVTPKDFWLVRQDSNYNNKYGIHLVDATMARLSVPKFDVAVSHAALFLELELRPASLETATPCCGGFSPSSISTNHPSRSGTFGSFRFAINGVNNLQYTKTVGPWEARQTTSGLDLDDLEFTITDAKAGDVKSWYEDFVLDEDNGPNKEKTATLELLSPSTSSTMMSWTFHVGLIGMEESIEGSTSYNTVSNWRTVIYVEEAAFTANGTAPPPPPPPAATTTTTTTTSPPPPPATTAPPPPPATEPPPPEEPKLSPPADVKASTGAEGEIEVAWATAEGAEGYIVLMATDKGGPYEPVNKEPTKETSQIVTGLKPGLAYYFVVHTVAGDAESGDSPEASATAG